VYALTLDRLVGHSWGPDPLHLSLVFNTDHSTALRYTSVAEHLLSDELEQPAGP
jgi:hypothetical protein